MEEMPEFLAQFAKLPQMEYFSLPEALAKSTRVALKGCNGSFPAVVLALMFGTVGRTIVIVKEDAESAAYFYHDLVQLLGGNQVYYYPSGYRRAMKYGERDSGNEVLRTEVLNAISQNERMLIVTYPDALTERVMSDTMLGSKTLTLRKGQKIKMSDAVYVLQNSLGFSKQEFVYEPGQFSRRGSILDVFSYSDERPYRVDFFGDEIESIRIFDVENQLSVKQCEKVSFVSDISGGSESNVCFYDFIGQDSVFAYSDYDFSLKKIRELFGAVDDNGQLCSEEEIETKSQNFPIIEFGKCRHFSAAKELEFGIRPQMSFNKNFDLLSEELEKLRREDYTIYIMTDSEKQSERLKAIFADKGRKSLTFETVLKTLHEGFLCDDLKMCCYTDHQIFERYHKYSLQSERARSGNAAMTLKMLRGLNVGDYVAHLDFGIGRFGGLMTMDMNGKKQEVIKLIYKDDDLVFVTIHSLHKISKYRSKEGEEPRVSKLGTGAWQTLKERTKKKVKDIARDLIALYSKRRKEQGYAFSGDSFLQQELESSFVYEDTPDQLKTTAEVKRDMEKPVPMDRLVCGDVGFGKTEIAIRAAFKAVTDNKQVAVLVPTTVLAFQHFQTFSERLKNLPCRVEYLSRTRNAKDTKRIVTELFEGKIDILIGTHKIIGKTVKFKDLGLLIIDEEQKFGVSTKEKIRQMKVNVDTLTLTATPIPRTLQFSLMGARDLSIMTTPPPNRYPVQTEVMVFDEKVIADAIRFELNRNGQVFFVSNRIATLEPLKDMINRAVPSARVVIGHGQMDGEQLEKVLIDFLNYDYDVLLSTTIIESGIDISNCNTIIINDAQNFGLSDLHQLRGRVGRSNRKAFCYLLSPPMSSLPEESVRRLKAIETFTQLGSGFSIAMQDLDIRGAGNLLGAEQSGFVADLGYETYHKILNEAVDELKIDEFSDLYGEDAEKDGTAFVTDCQMETDMELMLPEDYVSSQNERINLYRDLDNIKDEAELAKFEASLQDRFGPIPEQGKNLLKLVRVRWAAVALGFEKLVLKNGVMTVYPINIETSPYYQSDIFGRILQYVVSHTKYCQFRQNAKRSIVFSKVDTIDKALEVLTEMLGKK